MIESLEKAFLDDRQATLYPPPVPIDPSLMEGLPVETEGPSPAEFAAGAMDVAASTLKGAVQGYVGLPGDLESIGRMLINLVGGNVDKETYLKTTEEIKAMLDQYAPFEPIGKRIPKEDFKVTETIGEILAPGAYAKPVKTMAKAAKTRAGKAVATGTAAVTMPKVKESK